MRGLARLHEDGFIAGARSRGTSVVDAPPHLFHYGVALHFWSDSPHPIPRFWGGILNLLKSIEAGSQRRFTLYPGLDWGCPAKLLDRMNEDAARHRIAGIITMAHARYAVQNSSVIAEHKTPTVALTSVLTDRTMVMVAPELSAFAEEGMKFLAATGNRKVAILGDLHGPESEEANELDLLTKKFNMETRRYWRTSIPWSRAEWAGIWIQTVFRLPPEDRPDALLITDEHLTEPAAQALADLGLLEKIPVVAHSNFPAQGASIPGVTRLGFDLPKMLNTAIGHIDSIREKRPTPQLTLMPVILESDFLRHSSGAG
jgi:DNA-binding LacI/PurR family transcriptional regulator